jgi:hypothetical protein
MVEIRRAVRGLFTKAISSAYKKNGYSMSVYTQKSIRFFLCIGRMPVTEQLLLRGSTAWHEELVANATALGTQSLQANSYSYLFTTHARDRATFVAR